MRVGNERWESFRRRRLRSAGHGCHGKFVSKEGAGSEGLLASSRPASWAAVVGGHTQVGSSPHTPLGHGAVLKRVTSLELPPLFAKQGPFQKLLINLCCRLESP